MKRNPHNTAKELRQNMTEAEKVIWSMLRRKSLNCKFRRQHPVDCYIVDFICTEQGLIIEVDGGQHTPEKDAARTAHLEKRGYRILRFWNNEVLENEEGVFQTIQKALSRRG